MPPEKSTIKIAKDFGTDVELEFAYDDIHDGVRVVAFKYLRLDGLRGFYGDYTIGQMPKWMWDSLPNAQ